MKDDLNFRNEPKGLGPAPEKKPRVSRRKSKEQTETDASTGTASTAQPVVHTSSSTEPEVGAGKLPDGPPPRKVEPAEDTGVLSIGNWFRRTGYIIGIIGLPVVLIIYGVQSLGAARRGAEASKPRAIGAIVVGAGAILAIAGFGVYETLRPGISQSVNALERGDCLLGDGLGGGEAVEISNARVIACTEPHFAQVYRTGELTGAAFPGLVIVEQQVVAACERGLESEFDFLATDPELYLSYLFPTEGSWNDQDRGYSCLVMTDGGHDLTRSVLAP